MPPDPPRANTVTGRGREFGIDLYCDGCPAFVTCTALGTDDACSLPENYDLGARHPATMPHLPHHDAFAMPDFTRPDRTGLLPRPDVLFVGDGRSTIDDVVRLPATLAAARGSPHVNLEDRIGLLNGHDRLHRQLRKNRGTFGPAVSATGCRALIGPGFSTYLSRPQFEAELAIPYSAGFAVDFDEHLPTVPTLVFRNIADLDRQARWTIDHDRSAIALDAGSWTGETVWNYFLDGLAHLATDFGRLGGNRPHLYLQGCESTNRIRAALDIWDEGLTFLTQRPWYEARVCGQILTPDLTAVPAPEDSTWQDRYAINAEVFRTALQRLLPVRQQP